MMAIIGDIIRRKNTRLSPEESSGVRSAVACRQRTGIVRDDTKKRPKKRATLSSHSNFSLSSL